MYRGCIIRTVSFCLFLNVQHQTLFSKSKGKHQTRMLKWTFKNNDLPMLTAAGGSLEMVLRTQLPPAAVAPRAFDWSGTRYP